MGRSYGDTVDPIIANASPERILVRTGDLFQGLYRMLLAGRVDYMFGSPVEASYARRVFGGSIAVIPILGEDVISLGYAAYPDTPFGKSLAAEMEALLVKAWKDPGFVNLYRSNLDGISLKKFEAILEQINRGEFDQ
jgi:hypothetical protein